MSAGRDLGWFDIVRLGLAQMALGSMMVLATSTLNRVMVVELALPAIVPGLLVGLQYVLQVLRPNWGYSARGRGGWVLGGMALLAAGVVVAALATSVTARHPAPGLALAAAGYAAVGVGVGIGGTVILARLAGGVAANRRAAAATVVWLMMILGIGLTAGVAAHVLQPFSFDRLVRVVAVAAAAAMALTMVAVWRNGDGVTDPQAHQARAENFAAMLRRCWADRSLRRFAIFIFVSMLAYSGQELILEPFAGLVFHLPPGGTAALIGLQQGGVIGGMLVVAIACSTLGGWPGSMPFWTVAGCIGSALALAGLAVLGLAGVGAALRPCLFALGVGNGAFSVAAIGAMMQLAGERGRTSETGLSMGVFGAAQAIAMGAGGLASSGASDVARQALGSPVTAYGLVFGAEAALFLAAAVLAGRIFAGGKPAPTYPDVLGSLS